MWWYFNERRMNEKTSTQDMATKLALLPRIMLDIVDVIVEQVRCGGMEVFSRILVSARN
jgi:hypothetical protein